jgi:hypothetical protein
MPRGFVWGVYVDDGGGVWRLAVNADYLDQPQRGWVVADPDVTAPLPRSWLPRKVIGVTDDGRRRAAIVASLAADLWTGTSSSFEIEGSDQVFYPCSVIGSRGERRR